MFDLIYPETRSVPASTIKKSYEDAVANSELHENEDFYTDVLDQARALHDAGLITLGNKYGNS